MEHHFSPTVYHNTIGPHEPVLTVRDGDSIVTTTVDARGFDARCNQVATRGNPMTGPFFIEGAEPGDSLSVRLDEIVPSREYGYGTASVAPSVVDPVYVPELPSANPVEWSVDVGRRRAMLVSPRPNGFGDFSIPLAPMLGCFGVAPPRRQVISTATSGEYGGNMDYRGFIAGTTVHFPVFEKGALFFLGDGHAAQGDGEVSGSGIEISMNVRVTVQIRKQVKISWPRFENDEHIGSVGNARPLDHALQHATTEMLRWLQYGFNLSATGANLLLQQCVQYDVGNVFDPAYTMVCKVPREVVMAVSG